MALSSRTHRLLESTALAGLFALAYAQAPLFSSNQFQYMLHGMARAGLGALRGDWLANTTDPTPLFSLLVEAVFRLTGAPWLFYVFFALLAGTYLLALLSVLETAFGPYPSRAARLAAAAGLIATHAGLVRAGLIRLLGQEAAFLFDGGVAGQRLLGTVFQPSLFGVLLLAGLALALRGRPVWGAVLSAAVAAVHPTYLLPAALTTAAICLSTWVRTGRGLSMLAPAAAALAVALPTALFVWFGFQGASPQTAAEARSLLVNFRIPHHAVIAQWLNWTVWVKLGLTALALWATRRSAAVFTALGVLSLTATTLTMAQAAFGSDLTALLFPWRVSTLVVPLATAILVDRAARAVTAGLRPDPRLLWAGIVLMGLSGLAITLHNAREEAARPEQAVIRWARASSRPGDVYLTPIQMENFRLGALQPAYVDFLAIPYAPEDVKTWYLRIHGALKVYDLLDCKSLEDVRSDGGVSRALLPAGPTLECPGWSETYRDAAYRVLEHPVK